MLQSMQKGAVAGTMLLLGAVPCAQAAVDLIAIGQLDGHGGDRSKATAASLENGVPGNLLGGMGSGLAYAGCNTFLALPDRGPNADAYNSAVDDTVSYIDRFQTLKMVLKPSAAGAALPFTLNPQLLATTLLWSQDSLSYGDGISAGLPSGVPAQNTHFKHYFTGRSDNFDATQPSSDSLDARLDPESIRMSNDGRSVFISDEYGPYVSQYSRLTGRRLRSFTLPAGFAVDQLSAVGDDEIANNSSGRVANKGMEGLAISPDGSTLYGAMQSPLLQDGGTKAAYTRIVRIDIASGATREFAYPLSNIGSSSKPKYPTISDIVALNDHQFLVDERDGKGLGDDSTAAYKHVYLIDLAQAQDVSALSGEANLAPFAVAKSNFLDVVGVLTAHGIAATEIPAKLEGLAFGPDVTVGGVSKHTLFFANDNDFIGTVTDTTHPDGVNNPNQFFVFAFDDADLPGYVPQQIDRPLCR